MELPTLEPGRESLLPRCVQDTSYFKRTLKKLYTLYGRNLTTNRFCVALAYPQLYPEGRFASSIPAKIRAEEYNMNAIIRANQLPRPLPFVTDDRGIIIQRKVRDKLNPGDKNLLCESTMMALVVEAIRRTTKLAINGSGKYFFTHPTYNEILRRVPGSIDAFKHDVEECLSSGAGFNFLVYGKNVKRYVLLERAFNGTIILSAAACREVTGFGAQEWKMRTTGATDNAYSLSPFYTPQESDIWSFPPPGFWKTYPYSVPSPSYYVSSHTEIEPMFDNGVLSTTTEDERHADFHTEDADVDTNQVYPQISKSLNEIGNTIAAGPAG